MILSHSELVNVVANGGVENLEQAVVVDQVSICLHLDRQFCKYAEYPSGPVVPPVSLKCDHIDLKTNGRYTLPPGGKVLACSQEIVRVPSDLMGFVQTKGSIARGFLMAHPCDGQIDPGYNGKVTFEIVNLSDFYYDLVTGMPFASLFFCQLTTPVNQAYSGRYQNSYAPTPMR